MNRPVMEFRLRRPPFWTTRFTVGLTFTFLLAFWLGNDLAGAVTALPPTLVTIPVLAGATALVAGALIARALRYRSPPAPIQIYPDGLRLPTSLGSPRSFFSPWAALHTLEMRGDGERTFLLLGTKRRRLILPGDALERPNEVVVLHAKVMEAIVRQPQGVQLLETMRRGREAMRALVEMKPRVTRALLVSLAAAYGVQTIVAGMREDPLGLTALVELGANVPALVWEGQIDRLVTANFLHAPLEQMGLVHIGLNALGLWLLGGLMERLLGGWRYFVIYVVSAIGGAAASAFGAPGPLSVGASTAVLGLFGSLAVVHVMHLRSIPPAVRQPIRWWIAIIGINAALSLAVPNIDHWGHGGGLVAGIVATVLLTIGWPPLEQARRKERFVRPMAVALLVVTVAGIAVSWGRAAVGEGTDVARLGLQELRKPEPDPMMLNYHAWMIAIREDASHEDLEAALRMADRAHALAPDAQEITDTLAQAHWRLGHVDRAVELERQALTADTTPQKGMYASQLARFLERRVEQKGSIAIGDDVPALEVDVRDDRLHVSMEGEPPPTGLVAYVVVERGDPLPWLLELTLGPDARPPEVTDLHRNWPEGMRAHVALVDTTIQVPRGIDWRVEEHPPHADAAGLP